MLKENTNILIIGGGAAGLFTAASLINKATQKGVSPKITIVEKMEKCGRKIAITGKGRCNITNTKPWEELSKHIHPKNNFFRSAFYAMNNLKTMEFFEQELGLELVVERGDRVFPKSMKANDVTKSLVDYIKSYGADILTDSTVDTIIKSEEGFCVSIKKGKTFLANYVVVATGGLSYPTTGSSGDGYKFAEALGHKVTNCFPSLTALKPKNYREDLQGISLKNLSVQLLVNKQVVKEEFGDIDFTNGGIEGPIGFKMSRKAVQNLITGQKIELVLDLKPAVTINQIVSRIERELKEYRGANNNAAMLKFILPKLLPKQLITPFTAMQSGISINNLPQKLKEWRFEINGYVGYERCVVTAGGVDISELSKKTMESKFAEGLYFAGEVVDLDADTGGCNLQIAFSTGALVAQAIIVRL